MFLILLTVSLAGLKFFDVPYFHTMSWWWVTGSFFATFIWFEFFERYLGLDKKKAHKEFDEIQKTRAKKSFIRRRPR